MEIPAFNPNDYQTQEGAAQAITRIFSCECENTDLRVRTLSNGATALVRQCAACGNPSNSPVAKSSVPNWLSLPRFDDGLRTAWEKARTAAYALADQHFRERWQETYAAYLESEVWAAKRKRVLARDQHICQGCGESRATQVHHLTYDHVGDELLFELVSICDRCHSRVHALTDCEKVEQQVADDQWPY